MAIREVGTKYVFTYQEVKVDKETGWADPNKFLPYPYDIVTLSVFRPDKEDTVRSEGWWTGEAWDGRKLKPEYKIIGWKFQEGKNE